MALPVKRQGTFPHIFQRTPSSPWQGRQRAGSQRPLCGRLSPVSTAPTRVLPFLPPDALTAALLLKPLQLFGTPSLPLSPPPADVLPSVCTAVLSTFPLFSTSPHPWQLPLPVPTRKKSPSLERAKGF
ncbi:hypothetical protein HMPREF0262_01690 [Clostridium sp. ATCC 29733]|nr:hypothetical protein HMPREF0262_01690 [Clostridium sp. ATCC 29733]